MSLEKTEAHRLGTRELGPHAFEDRMPDRIMRILQKDGHENIVQDIIPRLAQLLSAETNVSVARLCCSTAVLVHRLAREGNTFCGYRNIQMLLQAIDDSNKGASTIPFKTVFEVQDLIEQAWDEGFNMESRVQTGGIRLTRKHIGTPEAEALLQSRGIRCTGRTFHSSDAAAELFDSIDSHYGLTDAEGIRLTARLPIFLQRPRHSLLVVGIARHVDNSRTLLVLDPALPPSLNAKGRWRSKTLQSLLNKVELATYCKSEKSMARYAAFETLSVD